VKNCEEVDLHVFTVKKKVWKCKTKHKTWINFEDFCTGYKIFVNFENCSLCFASHTRKIFLLRFAIFREKNFALASLRNLISSDIWSPAQMASIDCENFLSRECFWNFYITWNVVWLSFHQTADFDTCTACFDIIMGCYLGILARFHVFFKTLVRKNSSHGKFW